MARCDVKLPEDLLSRMEGLGSRFDEVASSVLEAGGKVVLDETRKRLSAVIGKDTKEKSQSTGTLLSSLGLSKARVGKNGNHDIKVGFSEHRADGKSNAMIANILEYGRHNQKAKPFLKPAKTASRSAAVEAMAEKLKEETG